MSTPTLARLIEDMERGIARIDLAEDPNSPHGFSEALRLGDRHTRSQIELTCATSRSAGSAEIRSNHDAGDLHDEPGSGERRVDVADGQGALAADETVPTLMTRFDTFVRRRNFASCLPSATGRLKLDVSRGIRG